MPPGTFGENLLLSDFETSGVRIGDHLQINSVLMEVTAPRFPCGILAARMRDKEFIKRFVVAERPGFYVRVLEAGEVQAGDKAQHLACGMPESAAGKRCNGCFRLR
jgi:MOSC domain-containing protein YiiM